MIKTIAFRARHTGLALALALPLPALAQVAPAATDDAAFQRCLQGITASAVQQGLPADRVQGLLGGIVADRSVLPLLNQQPEFTTPIWDYLAGLVDAQRVADGRQRLTEHAPLLQQVQRDYGVDPATVVAVWGWRVITVVCSASARCCSHWSP